METGEPGIHCLNAPECTKSQIKLQKIFLRQYHRTPFIGGSAPEPREGIGGKERDVEEGKKGGTEERRGRNGSVEIDIGPP